MNVEEQEEAMVTVCLARRDSRKVTPTRVALRCGCGLLTPFAFDDDGSEHFQGARTEADHY